MKNRCYNGKSERYKDYGARGVSVCEEWKNDFKAFYDWSMSHGYSDKLTIDRIDNNGNYEPSNCRWTTVKEQNRNSRKCDLITYNGETHCLKEWCEILHLSYWGVRSRRRNGWSIERMFETPIRDHKDYNRKVI